MHVIGRITAPTMWFFISEGLRHTRSKVGYFNRLAGFAVISHLPYAFGFGHSTDIITEGSSVMFTLSMAVGLGILLERLEGEPVLQTLATVGAILMTYYSDGSFMGLLMPIVLYRSHGRSEQLGRLLIGILFFSVYYGLVTHEWVFAAVMLGQVLSIPLLMIYNGERGKSNWFSKWGFYAFYPGHLVLLGLLRLLLWGDTHIA